MDEIIPDKGYFKLKANQPNQLERMPLHYKYYLKNKLFTNRNFSLMFILSLAQSFVLVFVTYYSMQTFYNGFYGTGFEYDIFLVGCTVLTVTVIIANVVVGQYHKYR